MYANLRFNFNLSGKSSVFYICLLDMKIPEDELKKIETFWSLGGLYLQAYVLIHVSALVLSIK
jgi:hypothetical protein